MAVVGDFYNILQQIHNKDCIHAGSKKTFARVYIILLKCDNRKSCSKFIDKYVVDKYVSLCLTCCLRKLQATQPPL